VKELGENGWERGNRNGGKELGEGRRRYKGGKEEMGGMGRDMRVSSLFSNQSPLLSKSYANFKIQQKVLCAKEINHLITQYIQL
jgi:hypothetical protein